MLQQQLSTVDKLLQTCLVTLERIDVFTCDVCHAVYCEKERLTRHLATHMNCEDTLVNDTEMTVRDGASRRPTLHNKKPDKNTMDSKSTHLTQQPYKSIRDCIRFETDSDDALGDTESSEDKNMSFSSDSASSNETLVVNKGSHIPKKVYTKKLTYRRQIAVTSDTDNCSQNLSFQTRQKKKKIQEDKQYSCDVCKKTFQTKRWLRAHLKLHYLEKNFMCKFCERLFMFNHQLKVHLRIHNNKRPYLCTICGISFRHCSSMSHHRRSVHRNFNDPTNASELPTCAICNRKFCQKSALLKHIFTHYQAKGYPCSKCDKEFGHPVTRDWHMNLHKGTFKCYVCGKCYEKQDRMRKCETSHMKPFECSNCNMKFGRKYHLTRHMRDSCKKVLSNLVVKPYRCQNCNSKFKRNEHLASHIKLYCKPKNNKCVKCKIRFAGTWQNHYIECKWKKYECDHCKKRFAIKKLMAHHITNNICRNN